MTMRVVYKTTNLINGKCYVGQDSKNNSKYLGSGLFLNNAIRKYSIDKFEKEIIAWCDTKDKLDFLEKFYIKFFNTKAPNGYNLTDGGDGAPGYVFTEIVKHKMSEAGKLNWGKDTGHRREVARKWFTLVNKSRIGQPSWNKGKKGSIPWNRGLRGVQIAWNKGLTKETDERVASIVNL